MLLMHVKKSMQKNKNKIICITGSSSGIGKALTLELLSQGCTVIGLARRKEKLIEIENETSDNLFVPYAIDVKNSQEIIELKNNLFEKNIIPDVIICAAGMHVYDTEPYNSKLIRETMETNFFGSMNMVDAFLPVFLEREKGHFIVLSSIAASKPNLRGISYSASKAAISMAFRGLNLKYSKLRINFSVVCLGPVETTMWEGKKSFLVTTPQHVSKKIIGLLNKPKTIIYVPFLSTTLSRISSLIPDDWYARLSSYLLK